MAEKGQQREQFKAKSSANFDQGQMGTPPPFPAIYDELRSIARSHWRRVRGKDVLQTTALVHEVYLRLTHAGGVSVHDRAHFLALAARTLHRIVVEHVRATCREKRGGRWGRVALTGDLIVQGSAAIDVLALEQGLEKLKERSPRQAQVVELRFFGGLSVEESAGVLGVSVRTVKDDWALARAFLMRELRADRRE